MIYEWIFSIITKKLIEKKKKLNSKRNQKYRFNYPFFFFFHFSPNWNEKNSDYWNDRRTNIRKISIKMSVYIIKQMVDKESSENHLQNVS